ILTDNLGRGEYTDGHRISRSISLGRQLLRRLACLCRLPLPDLNTRNSVVILFEYSRLQQQLPGIQHKNRETFFTVPEGGLVVDFDGADCRIDRLVQKRNVPRGAHFYVEAVDLYPHLT